MAYQHGNTFVFGEQPTASKMDQLWRNDDYLYDLPRCIQRQRIGTSSVATGTTTVPQDDTIPQFTEGVNFMSVNITPTSASSILLIVVNVLCSYSVPSPVIASLSVDGTGNALKTVAQYMDTAAGFINFSFQHTMTAGTTSLLTFRTKVGGTNAGTITFNGQSGARRFGTVDKSSIDIYELSS